MEDLASQTLTFGSLRSWCGKGLAGGVASSQRPLVAMGSLALLSLHPGHFCSVLLPCWTPWLSCQSKCTGTLATPCCLQLWFQTLLLQVPRDAWRPPQRARGSGLSPLPLVRSPHR